MAARFTLTLAALSIGFATPAVSQTVTCAPLEYALTYLAEKFGENPVSFETAAGGMLRVVRVENPLTGSYSVLVIVDGSACLVKEGREGRS